MILFVNVILNKDAAETMSIYAQEVSVSALNARNRNE